MESADWQQYEEEEALLSMKKSTARTEEKRRLGTQKKGRIEDDACFESSWKTNIHDALSSEFCDNYEAAKEVYFSPTRLQRIFIQARFNKIELVITFCRP